MTQYTQYNLLSSCNEVPEGIIEGFCVKQQCNITVHFFYCQTCEDDSISLDKTSPVLDVRGSKIIYPDIIEGRFVW